MWCFYSSHVCTPFFHDHMSQCEYAHTYVDFTSKCNKLIFGATHMLLPIQASAVPWFTNTGYCDFILHKSINVILFWCRIYSSHGLRKLAVVCAFTFQIQMLMKQKNLCKVCVTLFGNQAKNTFVCHYNFQQFKVRNFFGGLDWPFPMREILAQAAPFSNSTMWKTAHLRSRTKSACLCLPVAMGGFSFAVLGE